MPQPRRLPLEQLIYQCTQVDAIGAPVHQAAYCELLRRAICEENDRAWDVVLPYLRHMVLQRIYQQRPEVSPQDADRQILHTLTLFLTHLHRQPDLARKFPTYPALLHLLENVLASILHA